jgi:hypothetical protein
MGIGLVKGESSVFLKKEVTEGTYVAPASAGDAIEVLSDGVAFKYEREEIERNTLSSSIEVQASRPGLPSVSGDIPINYKAGNTEGAYPRESILYESLLGAKRQGVSVTSLTGHTSTKIYIATANINNFKKGDCVLIKEAGAYEVRPISNVDLTPSAEYIEFPFALENGAPSDNVVIAGFSTYYHDQGAPTFSATYYAGGEIEEKITGCRAMSASLESWETASIAGWKFSMEALNLLKSVGTPVHVPSFENDSQPPVLLKACVWVNGVHSDYSKLSLNAENTKSDILSPCRDSGKAGSRYTQFMVTGELEAYMEDDDVDRFDAFKLNSDVSIFGFASNPSTVAGEFSNVVAFYIPQAKVTQLPEGDADGILTDQISFKSYRKEGSDTLFLGFI